MALPSKTMILKNSTRLQRKISGIRVLDCPSEHDVIYNNKLEGLSYGNYAFGINRSDPGDDQRGVEYQCNENTDNAIDFIVTAEPGPDNEGMIRTYHGTPEVSSGNIFSQNPGQDEWHFRNKKYQNIDWFYYEPIDEEEPEKVFTLPEVYFTAIYQDVGYNNCPDHYGGGGGIGINTSTRQQLELDFGQNLNDYNAVQSLYESYIDGGNTDAELMDIEMAQPDDMWALRDQLLGDSPHLSQEVLREMAERTDVFPDDAIFDILAANPDELSRDSLLLFLEQKENPLPQYMIAILEQLVANVTYKTILERQMAEYHAAKVQAAQDIIRSIVHDSVFDATDYRNWLSNLESLEADKQIVSSYLNEEDYPAATSLLNMMASLYELTGDRLQRYNDYKDLMLLQISWRQNGRNVFQLDSAELAILGAYADNSKGHAQSIAQNILSQVNNTYYHECLYSDESIPLKQNRTISLDGFNDLAGPKVKVEPNPASTWAAFNYELKGDSPTATLQIVNAEGKVIHHTSLNGNQGQYVWDIRSVKSGMYLYIVTTSGLTTTGKLIIK